MVTLLAAVKSHYHINTHNTKTRSYEPGAGKDKHGRGEVAAGLLLKRKPTPGKRQPKMLRAALAARTHSVVQTKNCVACHTSFLSRLDTYLAKVAIFRWILQLRN